MTTDAPTAAAHAPFVEQLGTRARLRPATGAGVVLAVLLGALPAAVVGLEAAWLIVVSGVACLAMAPLLASLGASMSALHAKNKRLTLFLPTCARRRIN